MKNGILTYHFSINFGAVLQCYALQKALEQEGRKTYVINYISNEQQNNIALYRSNDRISNVVKNLLLLPFHKKRKRRNELYESFLDTYLNLTRWVSSQDKLKMLLAEMNIDYVFVGSDQVWNPRIKDFNQVFFLPNISGFKKIGYAVSLGEAGYEDLIPYTKGIRDFDSVTVRERSAVEIVRRIYEKDVDVVMDPTFLISMSHWKYMAGLSQEIKVPQKYILCYFLNKEKYEQNYKVAKEIASNNGCKVLLIDPRVSRLSILYHGIISAGPLEFLQYIFKSSLVVTDSFHGTVFSVLLNKPFYSINNNPRSNDTRKKELLDSFSLGDFYVTTDKINRLEIPRPNYNVVNGILEKKRIELIDNLLKM